MHNKFIVLLVALGISLDAHAFTKRAKSLSMDDGSEDTTTYSAGGASGTCDNVPPQAVKAFKQALKFSQTCKYGKLQPGKMIAINDYSAAKPTLYVFDQNGNCKDSMRIDWGRGPGPRASADRKITSCATPGSYRTPAGMHKTTYHNGGVWKDYNSMGLAGLSGQNSYGNRKILIHVSRAGNNSGGAYSIGCTGVPENKWKSLQKTLGHGSLVYNYFGDTSRKGAGCGNNSGQELSCGPAESVSGDTRSGGRVRSSAERSSEDEVESGSLSNGSGQGNSRGRGGAQ